MARNTDGKLSFTISLDNDQLRRDALQAQKAFQSIGNTAVSEGARIDTTFRNIAKSAGLVFGAQQAMQFARSIVQVRGEFQKLETAFGVLLGNKEKADKLMQDAVRLAATTPFSLQDVASGARQLLAYGFAADSIIDDLRRLGDVSAALGLPLERLTYLYGTTMTQGQLYSRDLLQFTTSGVPLLQALSDQFGVTNQEMRVMIEQGKIGFPEVQKAIYAMTGEGGQFNNMMGEMAKTIPGQIEKLKDAWQVMLNEIGKGQEGFINSVIAGASSAVEHYKPILEILKTLIVAYGTYKAATMLTAVVEQSNANVRYNAEIQALQALIVAKEQNTNADLQQMVADRQLTTVQAEKIATLRAVLAEQLKVAQAEAAAARVAVKSAKDAITADAYRLSALKAKVSALHEQYAAELAAGNTTKANTILERANAEAKKFRAVQASLTTNREQLSTLQTNAQNKTLAANTLQQNINNASKTAGAVATNIFTAAQRAAAMAVKSLTTAFKANPIGWIATAVMLAVSAFQMFKKATDESTTSIGQLEQAIKSEHEEVNKLAIQLSNANTKEEEREKIIKRLNEINPSIVNGINAERVATEQLTAQLKLYNEEQVKKAVAAKLADTETAAIGSLNDARVNRESEAFRASGNLDWLINNLKEQNKNNKELVVWLDQLRTSNVDIRQKYLQLNETFSGEGTGRFSGDAARNNIRGWVDSFEAMDKKIIGLELDADKATSKVTAYARELQKTLSNAVGASNEDAPLPTFDNLVAAARKAVIEAESELKKLQTGQIIKESAEKQATAIEGAQSALKEAQGRLNTLLGIDPKAYEKARAETEKQTKELDDLRAQLASDAAQAEIDAMDDGFAKRMSQLKRNHELEKAEIEANYAELARLQGGELTAEQQGQRSLVLGFVDDKFRSDAKAEQDAVLADMMTFTQRYEKIVADSNAKIKEAQMAGASLDSFGVLSDQENEAINRLAGEYAAKSADYEAFMRSVADASVEEIQAHINNARALISQIIEDGIEDGEIEKYLGYVARLNALKDQLKNDKPEISPEKGSERDWKKLYSTLQKVANEFEEIGDAIGGTAGEAIKLAGTIATSTISMIKGIKTVTGAAAASMTALEKASVILAIVGAALKIVQGIASIFSGNAEAAKRSAAANREYAQSLREIEVNDILDGHSNIFGTSGIDLFTDAVELANDALKNTKDIVDSLDFDNALAELTRQFKDGKIDVGQYLTQLDKVNGIESDFRSGWQKFWGSGNKNIHKFDINDFFDGETLNTEALQAWYDANKDGLDAYEKETLEGLIASGNEYAAAVEAQTEYMKSLWGDLASSIADNMIEAFLETGNAAANLEDVVADVAKNMAKSMIETELLDGIFNDDLKNRLSNLLTSGDQTGANNLIKNAIESAGQLAPYFESIMESVGLVAGVAEDAANEARTSASQDFAQASQDSIYKIDGILTNIQNHTYGIFELMKSSVPSGGGSSIAFASLEAPVNNIAEMMRANRQIQQANTDNILGRLTNIDLNTRPIAEMQKDIHYMRGRTDDMADSLDKFTR